MCSSRRVLCTILFLGLTRFRYCACSIGVCQAADDARKFIRKGGGEAARRSKPRPYCRSLVFAREILVCENRPPVHSRSTTVLMDELSGLLLQHLRRRFGEPEKWTTRTVQDGCRDILAYLDLLAHLREDFSRALSNERQPGPCQQTSSATETCCAAGVTSFFVSKFGV